MEKARALHFEELERTCNQRTDEVAGLRALAETRGGQGGGCSREGFIRGQNFEGIIRRFSGPTQIRGSAGTGRKTSGYKKLRAPTQL